MIAFYGYDGFLYSIGYLAGWIVALLVIAEPLKRLGKFTFADALDSRFNSRGIKLAAAISTLVVSVFYLIPQMVGAGSLIKPLLGLTHATGVVTVGVVVILIVVTAGMVSTTWVQFIKGGMLVIFCAMLTVMILWRGLGVGHLNADGAISISGRDGTGHWPTGYISALSDGQLRTGPLGPMAYLRKLTDSTIVLWKSGKIVADGRSRMIYSPRYVAGKDLLVPGGSPTFAGVRSDSIWKKLDF